MKKGARDLYHALPKSVNLINCGITIFFVTIRQEFAFAK